MKEQKQTFTRHINDLKEEIKMLKKESRQGRTEGGGGGARGVTPPPSENFVFFLVEKSKNEIFLLDLAKKGVAPPCLRDLGTPLVT
jgi:hypothetical protein